MGIRVNWDQNPIRVHQIIAQQPVLCQFDDMKEKFDDFSDIQAAEAVMKKKGNNLYKQCEHCWPRGMLVFIYTRVPTFNQ